MTTNSKIDPDLLDEAKRIGRLCTKKDAVNRLRNSSSIGGSSTSWIGRGRWTSSASDKGKERSDAGDRSSGIAFRGRLDNLEFVRDAIKLGFVPMDGLSGYIAFQSAAVKKLDLEFAHPPSEVSTALSDLGHQDASKSRVVLERSRELEGWSPVQPKAEQIQSDQYRDCRADG